MTQTILVTGATGAIGPRVVHALDQAGCRIHTFSIDTPTEAMFPQSVEVLVGDVTDQLAVQSAMRDVDAVIHMAALLHIVNPPPELREKYEHVNVGGTATIVEAAIRAGVKRVVLFSTIAVYGHSDGCVLNEMSPTNPDTFYARTKCAAEQIVLNARGTDGQPLGTVLRLGAIYGSRIKGNYEWLTRALAGNLGPGNLGTRSQFLRKLGHVPKLPFIPVGNGLNRRTLVYDKDVGRAAVLAVSHPAAAGRVFNVTDGRFYTMNDIIVTICNALGRRSPGFVLPVSPVRWAVGLLEESSKLFGRSSPITRDTIDKYMEDIAVDSQRIQAVLGFVPQYDFVTGWKETIKEMRCAGNL